ncbi:PadR family transcriptional regulator [Actinoplanes sp. TBRC 11911]|uniref:PadR family transcriptional regulator n=1 Tax=Actinoplanes sp. TBRC 11911 TaxID=2729386 RepID=UPI00145D8899|nr:PadR family transcriptional regulator [Actinoplanes sp. TBRC 11911]NMO54328.1 PadR family transcriptional regulator [Actinoplanes sp. TBRC 11911]
MSTAHVLLGLLAAGPRHGYDLKRAHDEQLPRAKPLAFGQVYATLGRLERDGFVVASSPERDGGPDRTSYVITEAGRAHLAAWLSSVEPPAAHVTGEIFSKVVVALLAADDTTAHDYLIAQRAAHMRRMRELTAAKTGPNATTAELIAVDYAIGHLDADLQWLQTTLRRVAGPDKE